MAAAAAAMMLLSSCLLPSDPPGDDIGVRWADDRLVVYLRICQGDRLESVPIYDESDEAARKSEADPIWSALSPKAPEALSGTVTLNDASAFAGPAEPDLPQLPDDMSVSYDTARDWGGSMRFHLSEVPRSPLAADQYWTPHGIKSRDQLLEPFPCTRPTDSMRS